jgi:hypothetical protein
MLGLGRKRADKEAKTNRAEKRRREQVGVT